MLMRFALAAAVLAVAACSEAPATPKRAKVSSQEQLSKTPQPRVFRYTEGELRIYETPVDDGSGFVESQRCFVWRDEVYKTASISCGQMPSVLLTN